MSDMIPFDQQAGITTENMPDISPEAAEQAKKDMGGGLAGQAVPRIAVRNGNFWLQPGGTTEPQAIGDKVDVIIVAMPPTMQRSYYEKAYDPNAEGSAPDCFSADNEAPSPNASNPQSDSCKTCPQNQKGSARGGGEQRACAFKKSLVVMAPDQARVLQEGGEPEIFLMAINGGSMFAPSDKANNKFSLQGYYDFLNPSKPRAGAVNGIPFQFVVTHLEHDLHGSTQSKLFFSAKGWLAENLGELVWKFSSSDRVVDLLDVALSNGEPAEAGATDTDDKQTKGNGAKKAASKKAAKKPAKKAAAKKPAAPAPATAPAPAAMPVPAEAGAGQDISWQDYARSCDADDDDIETIEDAGGPGTEKGLKRWNKLVGAEIPDNVILVNDTGPSEPEPAFEETPTPDGSDEADGGDGGDGGDALAGALTSFGPQ